MSVPTNTFYLQDAWTSEGGEGTGLPCSPDFIAPSLTAAYQVAYLFATIIQSAVRLVNKFSNASGAFGSNTGVTSTLIGPGACNVALTFVPSGVYLVNAAMG